MRIEEYSVIIMPQISSFGFSRGAQRAVGEAQELDFPGVHPRVAGVLVLPKASSCGASHAVTFHQKMAAKSYEP